MIGAVEVEIGDDVLAIAAAEHERVGAAQAGELVVAALAIDDLAVLGIGFDPCRHGAVR